jgi:hypothetical protein
VIKAERPCSPDTSSMTNILSDQRSRRERGDQLTTPLICWSMGTRMVMHYPLALPVRSLASSPARSAIW